MREIARSIWSGNRAHPRRAGSLTRDRLHGGPGKAMPCRADLAHRNRAIPGRFDLDRPAQAQPARAAARMPRRDPRRRGQRAGVEAGVHRQRAFQQLHASDRTSCARASRWNADERRDFVGIEHDRTGGCRSCREGPPTSSPDAGRPLRGGQRCRRGGNSTASRPARLQWADRSRAARAAPRIRSCFNPTEVASLHRRFPSLARAQTYDSLRVELLEGSLAVHARLDTRALPPTPWVPSRHSCSARGRCAWAGRSRSNGRYRAVTVREISLQRHRLPRAAVKSIARQAAGGDEDGAIPLQIDQRDFPHRIHPTRRHPLSHAVRSAPMSRRVLIVDDEKGIREALSRSSNTRRSRYRRALRGTKRCGVYPEFRPHLVFLDVKMGRVWTGSRP